MPRWGPWTKIYQGFTSNELIFQWYCTHFQLCFFVQQVDYSICSAPGAKVLHNNEIGLDDKCCCPKCDWWGVLLQLQIRIWVQVVSGWRESHHPIHELAEELRGRHFIVGEMLTRMCMLTLIIHCCWTGLNSWDEWNRKVTTFPYINFKINLFWRQTLLLVKWRATKYSNLCQDHLQSGYKSESSLWHCLEE